MRLCLPQTRARTYILQTYLILRTFACSEYSAHFASFALAHHSRKPLMCIRWRLHIARGALWKFADTVGAVIALRNPVNVRHSS